MKQLCLLDLRSNKIESIEKNVFLPPLKNLQKLDLRSNFLRYFDPKIFSLKKSTENKKDRSFDESEFDEFINTNFS